MKASKCLCVVLIAGVFSGSVSAGTLSFDLVESGGFTTLTVSGSLSTLSGWNFVTDFQTSNPGIQPSRAYTGSFRPSGTASFYTRTSTPPSSIGSSSSIYVGNGISGDNVGFQASSAGSDAYLFLPQGYVPGSPINSSSSFNFTLSAMGLTPGTFYSWIYGIDTVAINVVPEPSTYAMALAGLACGGYSMWRRRKRA